jgi:hypothetical protein
MSTKVRRRLYESMPHVYPKSTESIQFVHSLNAGFKQHKNGSLLKISVFVVARPLKIKKNSLKVCFSRMAYYNWAGGGN